MSFIIILAGVALAGPVVGIVKAWLSGPPNTRRLVLGGLWGGIVTGVLASGVLLALPHASLDPALLVPIPAVAALGAVTGFVAAAFARLFVSSDTSGRADT